MASSSTAAALGSSLDVAIGHVEPALASVLLTLAHAVAAIAAALRSAEVSAAGSTNSFGDDQIHADILADDLLFKHLAACPAVESASSEERSDILPQAGRGYSVVFDPLDGSSIFDACFAVGTIFGVFRGASPLGQTGRDQAAAGYAVYGPRTLLVLAVPSHSQAGAAAAAAAAPAGACGQQQQQPDQGGGGSGQQQCGAQSAEQPAQQQQQPGQQPEQQQQQAQHPSRLFDVLEFTHLEGRGWQLRHVHTQLGSRNSVAPANIKAAATNGAYQRLLLRWIGAGCKLRYSGGMVPDIHHILAKGGGVFCNPHSPTAPAKLRLLYECAPLALVVEAAGGVSSDGQRSILDLPINDTSTRSIIAVGSGPRVAECLEALRDDGSGADAAA